MNSITNNIKLHPVVVPVLLFLLCFFSSCSKSNDGNTPYGTPGVNEVWIQGSAYNPATKTVAVNTTVTWTNKDSFAHTVTSDSVGFDSGNLPGSSTFNHTFTAKGTYKYHCAIHTMMTGKIIVQ